MSHLFRKRKQTYQCESIDGRNLCLVIYNSDLPEVCSEFIVENRSCPSRKRMLCVVIFYVLSLIFMYILYYSPIFVLIVLILLGYQVFKLLYSVQKETLLVIAPVGLQFTTKFISGYESSHFIPWYCIVDVVINEAISLQRVLFYLAVIVNDKDGKGGARKLIPLFQFTKPRLKCLERVYINIQRLFNIYKSDNS